MIRSLLLAILLLAQGSYTLAQFGPYDSFNYQAVARDANGDPLVDQSISLRLTISYGLSFAYQETHAATTNELGLFSVKVGQGTTTGFGFWTVFDEISWGDASFWGLIVEMDPTGGTNYQGIGSDALTAVPYALNSRRSEMLGDSAWVEQGNVVYNTNKNVGIGTDAPTQKFEVRTATSSFRVRENFTAGTWTTAAEIEGTTPYGPTVLFRRGGGSDWYLGMEGDRFRISQGGAPHLFTASPDARIGIKNNAPEVELDVKGNVRIAEAGNVNGPDPSAALEVASTTGAVLLPRMNTAQRDALTGTPGMIVYNMDVGKFQGFAGPTSDILAKSDVGNGTASTSDGPAISDGVNMFQSFQVTKDGTLDSLVLWVTNNDPVNITLSPGTPVAPAGVPLWSQGFTFPSTGRTSISLPGIAVTAGTDYYFTFIVSGQSGSNSVSFSVEASTGGTGGLATGSLWFQPSGGPIFESFGNDIRFQVISATLLGEEWVDLH